ATVLLHRAFADGTAWRASASSITSSWYSVAWCTSSIETEPGTSRGSEASPKWPESSTRTGLNRFPPAASRYCAVSASMSESARTAFSSAASTSSRRPRISRSSTGSGDWRPGIMRRLIAPTLPSSGDGCGPSPSQHRRPLQEAHDQPGEHAEDHDQHGRHREGYARQPRLVGAGVLLRLAHEHQHDDPQVDEGRDHAREHPDQDQE